MRRHRSKPPLKVAVIGAGLMGRWHAHYARRLGAHLEAIVDQDVERATSLASAYADARAFTDSKALFESCEIDVVHICTPLSTHVPIVSQAIDAGVHALVEKPLAGTGEETKALFDRAQAAGVLLCPVHQFAFQRGVARAARALQTAGDVHEVSFTICSAGGEGQTGEALDAIVADTLPHAFSVLTALWPNEAFDTGRWAVERPEPGEMLTVGRMNKAVVGISVSMHARPTACELIIRCSNATIEINFFHGYSVNLSGNVSRTRKITHPFVRGGKMLVSAAGNLMARSLNGEPAYPGLRRLMAGFYGAILQRETVPIAPEDAIAVAKARDLLIQRSSTHRQA